MAYGFTAGIMGYHTTRRPLTEADGIEEAFGEGGPGLCADAPVAART